MEPPAAKEAPPPPQPAAEEDAILSATAAMAKEASVSFQGRRYSECALVLAKLLEMKEGDPKVRDWFLLSCYYYLCVLVNFNLLAVNTLRLVRFSC